MRKLRQVLRRCRLRQINNQHLIEEPLRGGSTFEFFGAPAMMRKSDVESFWVSFLGAGLALLVIPVAFTFLLLIALSLVDKVIR